MLTRLKIDGFKNLVGVDISFGPFTCIAGANAVGKSNLFDAIVFLSDLTEKSFYEAAISIRGDGKSGDANYIKSLFFSENGINYRNMSFDAEFIIPPTGIDNLRQPLKATITFLKYSLKLRLREDDWDPAGPIALEHESLTYITQSDAKKHLPFVAGNSSWINSVVKGKRNGGPFISTGANDISDGSEGGVIRLHQDGGRRGKPIDFQASDTPRTLLSATNFESPTALLAKQEIRSWRRLQLESSAMRQPDDRSAPSQISAIGAHLAKTLYALEEPSNEIAEQDDGPSNYSLLSQRLSELLDDVHEVKVDIDEHRNVMTLMVAGKDKAFYPARSLSDGTLRFLALGILELSNSSEVLCLEEPENGIHPTRIGAMLQLLRDIAVDVEEPTSQDNPLRQVIVNTHSPGVVEKLEATELVVADIANATHDAKHNSIKIARFAPVGIDSWRSRAHPNIRPVTLTSLVDYLTYSDRARIQETETTSIKQLIESQLKLNLD